MCHYVLLRFSLGHTFTFVILNCLIVLCVWISGDPNNMFIWCIAGEGEGGPGGGGGGREWEFVWNEKAELEIQYS